MRASALIGKIDGDLYFARQAPYISELVVISMNVYNNDVLYYAFKIILGMKPYLLRYCHLRSTLSGYAGLIGFACSNIGSYNITRAGKNIGIYIYRLPYCSVITAAPHT